MKKSAPIAVKVFIVVTAVAMLLSTTGCRWLRARDQLGKGVKAYKDNRFEAAIEHFKTAVELDDNYKVAKLYLATAYAQQYVPGVDTPENTRNAQEAIKTYLAVLDKEPGNINSLKGIAYLYMNMKKFDESREYYKKSIDADPNDPEAYYSVGVIDWTAAYKDTADRKSKEGLQVDDELKGKKDQKLCEEIRAANSARVDEGMKMLKIATEKREYYDDAAAYVNLLYLRKADMSCNDPEARAQNLQMSNDWVKMAMDFRRKKAEEAAKHTAGSIVLDEKKPK
jgi:tetratricopeptide (TPR) repeat protein